MDLSLLLEELMDFVGSIRICRTPQALLLVMIYIFFLCEEEY